MIKFANYKVAITRKDAAKWQVRRDAASDAVVASGPCPACDASLDVPIDLKIVVTRAVVPASARLTRTIHCTCDEDHPERPPETPAGCGRSWSLTITASGTQFSVEPGDVSLEAASQELSRAVTAEVSTVRTSAEKWIAGVTALLGLFGISGLAIGKDSVKDLGTGWKVFAAALAIAGVVAAVIAILSGYRAAYGWPEVIDVSDDEKLRTWFKDWTSRGKVAAERVRKSVVAAVIALTSLTAVAGVVWFAPAADPSAPKVLVKYNLNGDESQPSSACGSLGKATDGMIHVQVADGGEKRTVKIQPSWTTSLAPAASC